MAAAKVLTCSSFERTIFLKFAQKISIGFKSGEYAGRNKILHPAFSISFRDSSDL